MADEKNRNPIAPITDEDISALQEVLNNLKSGAREANANGNLTTFRVYQKLTKVVSPEVVKAQARKERQDLARMNKDGEALKNAAPRGGSTEQ